jgi:hypothetical protein
MRPGSRVYWGGLLFEVIIGRLQFRSDKNEGGDSWGEGDPEHDAKPNKIKQQIGKDKIAKNLRIIIFESHLELDLESVI